MGQGRGGKRRLGAGAWRTDLSLHPREHSHTHICELFRLGELLPPTHTRLRKQPLGLLQTLTDARRRRIVSGAPSAAYRPTRTACRAGGGGSAARGLELRAQ